MATKTFEKGSKEFMFFSDLWKLSQSIWLPENNDDYYEDALRKIVEFDQKYNTPYSLHFSTALTKIVNDFSVLAGYETGKVHEEVRGMG